MSPVQSVGCDMELGSPRTLETISFIADSIDADTRDRNITISIINVGHRKQEVKSCRPTLAILFRFLITHLFTL